MRLSFVGELGWELHFQNESAVPVYQAVVEAGKQYGIINAGYRAMDTLSNEKGVLEEFTRRQKWHYYEKIKTKE